jgi:Kef-type K+ transport system membrane component KefB
MTGVGGVAVALALYPGWAGRGTDRVAFALFMACALAITALPVLARILREHGMAHTRVGVQSILAAAIADVTAWCLLAVAIAVGQGGSAAAALVTIGLTAGYALLLLGPGRVALRAVFAWLEGRPHGEELASGVLVVGILLSGWVTSVIGVHAIFGAFLFGVIAPDGPPAVRTAAERLDTVTATVLLPFFFLGTGLRTDLWHAGPLGGVLGVLGVVVLVATAGKVLGPFLVARVAGVGVRDALRLGALLNARGLTELIVLNIGLSLGIIAPRMFVVLVLMAVLTTAMTGPALAVLGTGVPGTGRSSLASPDQLDGADAQHQHGGSDRGEQGEQDPAARDRAGQHAG